MVKLTLQPPFYLNKYL